MTQLPPSSRGLHPDLPRTALVDSSPTALIVGDAPVRLWGLSSRQRIGKQLQRLQIAQAPIGATAGPGAMVGSVVVVHAGWVYDEPLLAALTQAAVGTLLLDEISGKAVAAKVSAAQAASLARALETGSEPPTGLQSRTPATLASHYNNKLRKRETPYLLPLSAGTLAAIEKRMFAGSYKGVTDAITKYLWPLPARHVTKWCANVGITPNQVTFVSLLMVIAAFQCFWTGHFGFGLVAAWIMTFLDTVDGKLARVTLNSSKFGDVFDHGIDLIHPPFWWWAWIVGLGAVGLPLPASAAVLAIVVVGYVAQRLEEALFMKAFGIEMHIWRRFDSWFRLITARRNPNLLLLTLALMFGRPDLGMLAVAAWTVLCFFVHALQIVQAFAARRQGAITSWLSH
ncbi:CDP-alcohol phosphatidyltransferase family protein [Hydrocarboniphaga sp.]|uniref:CDP-alcohol phosphatidyltransferase family protein n=1 Tax=Hydrocarboniphaga sp. TaxID=2033016 RepID=UPI002603F697|nr:CDP-alcohol phosphatidyltransferase family protein [Hydrocarboniphaga sp.]